jgi:DNA-binding response OmpR family regulator
MEKRLKRIAIVDDDERIVEVMEIILKAEGYSVCSITDSEKAFDQVRAFCPDLVLLDLMMPIVDGWHVLKQMRAHRATSPIPVLVVTAKSGCEEEARRYQADIQGIVIKPFEFDDLLSKVRQALTQRTGLS